MLEREGRPGRRHSLQARIDPVETVEDDRRADTRCGGQDVGERDGSPDVNGPDFRVPPGLRRGQDDGAVEIDEGVGGVGVDGHAIRPEAKRRPVEVVVLPTFPHPIGDDDPRGLDGTK